MDWNSLMSNPQFLMGMGMLSGNYGTNKRQAFANAMGSGLQGLQQAQIASLRAKAEERAQAEEERKQKEYERMVQMANAQRQLAMGKLHQPYEQDLFPGEQPIPGLYGPENPNLSADEKTSYELIAAGYNPAVAGQFANYLGTEGRAAQAHADRMELQRAQDAAAMQRAQIQAGGSTSLPAAGKPNKPSVDDWKSISEQLSDEFDPSPGMFSNNPLNDSGVQERLRQEVERRVEELSNIKGGRTPSYYEVAREVYKEEAAKYSQPKGVSQKGWTVTKE